ncbi:hypothetical protein [Pseudomonas antarctica]|uniref:hypothetical protein n=1 Tax=Pseudomonas antarctica TaxID=219572 RepID=UPI0009F2AE3E|nr:hypothetical protein [Pseudomonas antarctica]
MQKNTPAVLWLYTQDLKSFVSQTDAPTKMELCGAWAVFISKASRKQMALIAQNAGCTMAIHAICTKSKIHKISKPLIYKDIL